MRTSNKKGFIAPALVLFVLGVVGLASLGMHAKMNMSTSRATVIKNDRDQELLSKIETKVMRDRTKTLTGTLSGEEKGSSDGKSFLWYFNPLNSIEKIDYTYRYDFENDGTSIKSVIVADPDYKQYLLSSENRINGSRKNYLVSSNTSDQSDIYSREGSSIQLPSVSGATSLYYRYGKGDILKKEDYPSNDILSSDLNSLFTYLYFYGDDGRLQKFVRAIPHDPVPLDLTASYARIIPLPKKDISINNSIIDDYGIYNSLSIWSSYETSNSTGTDELVNNMYLSQVNNLGGQSSLTVGLSKFNPDSPVEYEISYLEDGVIVATKSDITSDGVISFSYVSSKNTDILDLDQIYLLNAVDGLNKPITEERGVSIKLKNGVVTYLQSSVPKVISAKYELKIQNSWGANLRVKDLIVTPDGN